MKKENLVWLESWKTDRKAKFRLIMKYRYIDAKGKNYIVDLLEDPLGLFLFLLSFILLYTNKIILFAKDVYLGGDSIGIELRKNGVIISGTYDIIIDNKVYNSINEGIKIGDVIIESNDQKVSNSKDFITSIYDTKNTRKRNPCDIVLGIDYEKQKVEEAHSFLYKSQQNIHNLDKTFQLFNEAQLFIIYGCSLGDSDMIYFKEIFSEAQEGKTFLIYGYGPDSLGVIETNIKKISTNYTKFYQNNTLIYLDVKEVQQTREETRRILENL